MKNIKEYIQKNATPLFKTSEKNILKSNFDNNGFWFHECTQTIYDVIKSQPHIYVAFNKNGYYVGISNQSGGRWKRQHAYHLGTLAYHLLGTLKKYDQNHMHWIEAWMKMETLKSNNLQNSIILKKEVNICFIPFSLYSEFNNHHTGNSLPPKNIIRKVNKEFEAALIQSLKEDGKKMLNVQNLKKKTVLQTNPNGKKTPPPKGPKVAIDADFVIINNACVEFKVKKQENIYQVAKNMPNLPVGHCRIELFSKDRNDIRKYINNKVRKTGRKVSEYFDAPDTNNGNVARWKIVQAEMNYKKKIIETITVRVCPIRPSKTKIIMNCISNKIVNASGPLKPIILSAILKLYQNGKHRITARELKVECYSLDSTKDWNRSISAICNGMRNVIDCGWKVISKEKDFNEFTIALNSKNGLLNDSVETKDIELKKTNSTITLHKNKILNVKETTHIKRHNKFIVVMICGKRKDEHGILKYNNQELGFQAISNRKNNIYLPDDEISINSNKTWRDYIIDNQQQLSLMAYELYKRIEYRNLYKLYKESFYILSAGWGLVNSEFRLPYYDITFSRNADINITRIYNDNIPIFNDFNQLINIKEENDIIFIGSDGYLPLFFKLTENMSNKKILYWKNKTPKLSPIKYPIPNDTFEYKYYETNRRQGWYYDIVNDLCMGVIP